MKNMRFPRPSINITLKSAFLRLAVIFLLVIGFLCAAWIYSPATSTLAASTKAKPEPTPPDKETVDALLEQLKESLVDAIGDEDAVNSIIERWDRRILVGKTKKQIIDLLLADVKAVTKNNRAKENAVKESWSEVIAEAEAEAEADAAEEPAAPVKPPARSRPKPTPEEAEAEEEAEEPAAPVRGSKVKPASKAVDVNAATETDGLAGQRVNGRFVLTDLQKKNKGETEWQSFQFALNRVKVWNPADKRQYRGQSYSIYVPISPIDPNADDKIAGIEKAVKTIVDRGFDLPHDLRFYCTSDISTQTQAFKRTYNWAPISYIFLGPGGSEFALSTTAAGFNGFDTRTMRTMHEIGHIIHERQADDSYWDATQKVNTLTAEQVSKYAGNAFKEFVAEVFVGLMIRKPWSSPIMAEYRKFDGPMP